MQYDSNIAIKIIDKYILIGISYFAPNGELESQQQLHGIVKSTSETDGVIVDLCGVYKGEKLCLPPDTSTITAAEPGTYKLSNTAEEVENPDYLGTYQVHKSEKDYKQEKKTT